MKDRYPEKGSKRYWEIEHPSDMGLAFQGKSMEELFQNAGEGMFSLITDLEMVDPVSDIGLKMKGMSAGYEEMLIDWLEKLLYYYEVEDMLFSRIKVIELVKNKNGYLLKAVLYGEKADRDRHIILNEIKAPTYQFLSIHKDDDGKTWEGNVVFDV